MAVLNIRVNDALTINPPAGDQFYTVNGSNWSWTVAAVYTLTFVIVYALSFKARAGEKFFHYLFTVANLVGAITYFALASDIGFSVVEVSNNLNYGLTRQIFFAKYINWVVNFPIAIISLGVLSGVSWTTIIYNIFLSWTWIISYLVGAYTTTNYKWGFFAFGTVAWIALAISTLTTGLTSAGRVDIRRDYITLAGWLNLLWLLYPIAWGLSDGGNKIGVTPSFIFFGVLDILLIPVLTYATIVLSRKWDYGKLNIAFTQYGRVASAPGTYPEKAAPAPAATAAV
ncbi:heat shock protein 30 [Podospora aff. communis PSN243]|uniref:Heat shock protein 30 n=1 Tax=Podospora aff. communis PSN243 TaxID=3040156 RepID=A0AAV9H4V4_9PEZI|nr:heat shock protein 30 [Podospora aff. communis PSN243]